MTTPRIQALGITQEGAPTRWKATGYVDGVGWLDAWGTSLIAAMEALQMLAAQRVLQREQEELRSGPRCMASRQDGTFCQAPASLLEPHRGGLVCIAHAFDTYHCPTHGARSQRYGEVYQTARDEVWVYVCTLCGQVADPTPFDTRAAT